ncbi:polyprenyl synthetase family protein [Streptomyces sp. Wh19]|uniref:polyprenyl synthetase family protein n=1 Tax=Streptomyces sp. Wh19 TaxID=3076629 RepID=UPI003FA39034
MINEAAPVSRAGIPSRTHERMPAAPFGTPHPREGLEWWYLNGRLRDGDGHEHQWMATITRHEDVCDRTAEPGYICYFMHADAAGVSKSSWVTPGAHRSMREAVSGDRAMDQRVRVALMDVLADGPLLPDRPIEQPVSSSATSLDISLGDLAHLRRQKDGTYRLGLPGRQSHFDLTLVPRKPAVPQLNDAGYWPGRFPDNGDALTTHVLPRLDVHGSVVTQQGTRVEVEGQAWFEHTWGGAWHRATREPHTGDRVWQRAGVQLDNGWEISAAHYCCEDPRTGARSGEVLSATVIAPDGTVGYHAMSWQPTRHWTSAATLNTYPTAVRLVVADLDLDVEVTAPETRHEIRALATGRAVWEGPAKVTGTLGATPVTGLAFLETLPVNTVCDFEHYTRRAHAIACEEAAAVYPPDPTGDLTALAGTEHGPHLDPATRNRLGKALSEPVRDLLDGPGRAWRSYAGLAVLSLFGVDPEPYRPLAAATELLHTASLIIDDIQDESPLRRGRPTAHQRFGTAASITAGTAAYFTFDPLIQRIPQHDAATMLRVYRLYLRALRTAHTGQALDIAGHREAFDRAVDTGDNHALVESIRTAHRLKTGTPVRCFAEAAAVLAGAGEEQIAAIGQYFEAVGTVYQISDDVADLDGVSTAEDRSQGRTSKLPAEDLRNGKISYPVAHALARLGTADRRCLRDALYKEDAAAAGEAVGLLTGCGTPHAVLAESRETIDQAWSPLERLLPATQQKAMLHALGWYAAQRIPDEATPLPGPGHGRTTDR